MLKFLKESNKIAYSLFLIFVIVFIVITIKGLKTPQPGDENVYYYMGKLITEGKTPYKDFFFAHPPLHIYLIALIYKLVGFKIIVLKLIPLVSTLISSKFIFSIAKNKFGYYEAVVSSFLFLFSYSVMFNSVFSFGIDVAAMFLVIGVYFLLNMDNHLLAGTFFGLAGITRLLSLVPVFILFAVILLRNRKSFFKLSAAFFIILLLANASLLYLFGNEYATSVYKFHLLKSFGGKENFREYLGIIKLNWFLFSSSLLFFFVKGKKQITVFAVISVIYMIFLSTLKNFFGFYFIIIFPFLAIIGGYSIVNFFRGIFSKKFFATRMSREIFLLLVLSIFIWNLASDILFLQKVGFKGFERGKDVSDFINSNSNKNTVLFGDDSVVPLMALMTNKKIALDFVDTNPQVFISGVKDLSRVLADLKGKEVLFIIRSKQGISSFKVVREFLNGKCEMLSSFHDKTEGDYLVYGCR